MDETLQSKMDEMLQSVIRTRIAELEAQLLDCHFVETTCIDDELDELRQLLEQVLPLPLTRH